MEPSPPFSRLVFAQPNYSFEDIPTGLSQADALDLHVAWTSLWHPEILHNLGFLPESRRTDTNGLDVEQALIVVPNASKEKLDQTLEERIAVSGSKILFTNSTPRLRLFQDILALCSNNPTPDQPDQPASDPHEAHALANDFFAFGFAVQQIQCMARKLRYSFNLDWMVVSEQILAAANHFHHKQWDDCERFLAAAFDSLSQERDRYCSQQAYLLNLILTAPVDPSKPSSPLGKHLSDELSKNTPASLLISSESLQRIKTSNPDAWKLIQTRLDDKSLALLGGFSKELRHTYLSELSLLRSLSQARRENGKLELPPTTVLTQFHPSIPGYLPTIAKLHGFQGSLIANFSDGTIPEKEHAKLRWQETADGSGLDTILGHVIDANDPLAILNLGTDMAKQLDYHQVPTLVIAHWPNRQCLTFDDLLRVASRSPALGKWIQADEYFDSTSQPYWSEQFATPQFPFPIKKSSPHLHGLQIGLIRLQALLYRSERIQSALELLKLLSPQTSNHNPTETRDSISRSELISRLEKHLVELDQVAAHDTDCLDTPESWFADRLADTLSLETQTGVALQKALRAQTAYTILNPTSAAARVHLNIPSHRSNLILKDNDRIVQACDAPDNLGTELLVDVPPFGFSCLQTSPPLDTPSTTKNTKETAQRHSKKTGLFAKWLGHSDAIAKTEGLLSNEFMEVQFDPSKGHMKSMYIRDQRGNRLSAMLSLLDQPLNIACKPREEQFLTLQSTKLDISNPSEHTGQIAIEGTFPTTRPQENVNKPQPLFKQTFTMVKNTKWLQVRIEGNGLDRNLHAPVWRMIWPSEAASLSLWANGNKSKWLAPLQASTEVIEIDDAQYKLYFATGGLSFHRKISPNQLATFLPIDHDGSLDVTFFIGLQWQRPWQTAMELFAPAWIVPPCENQSPLLKPNPKPQQSAWLIQSNHPNLNVSLLPPESHLTNHLTNQLEEALPTHPPKTESTAPDFTAPNSTATTSTAPAPSTTNPSPPTEDLTFKPDALLWVRESAGISATAKISLPKTPQIAFKMDFTGQTLDKLECDAQSVHVPYGPHERFLLGVTFDQPQSGASQQQQ